MRDRIQKMVKNAADKSLSMAARKATKIQREYPSFYAWLNRRFNAQWETVSFAPEIVDYQTAQWNGRTPEGIVIRAQIEQKNAIRGVRQTNCFTFSLVNDDEFSVERDPLDVACPDEREVIAEWKARRQFKSLWNAE